MSSPKLINNLSDKDLTKILEKTTKKEKDLIKGQYSSNNDFLQFLLFYNIKQGKNFIRETTLFRLYTYWSKYKYSLRFFQLEIRNHLLSHFDKYNKGYLINIDSFNISNQLYNFVEYRDNVALFRSLSFTKHVENFLKKYNLKSGDYPVTMDILYYLYDKWTYSIKKQNPLTKIELMSLLRPYINKKNSQNRILFLVDRSILTYLTKKDMKRITKGVYAKKAKSKKPSTLCRIESQIQSKN